MEAPLPPPAPPGVLARLTEALRLHPRYVGREDAAAETERAAFHSLFPTARYNARAFVRVAVEGVRADAGVVGIVWQVSADPALDPPMRPEEKRSLGSRLRTWQSSPEWSVEALGPNAYRVTEHMTLRALRERIASSLGKEDAGLDELPLTVAPPIVPVIPLTPLGVKLIARKLMPHLGGEVVPTDVLRDVVAALPGWGWTQGRVLAEPLDDKNSYHIHRDIGRFSRLGKALSTHVRMRDHGNRFEMTFANAALFFPTSADRGRFTALMSSQVADPGPWSAGEMVVGSAGVFGRVRGWTGDNTFVIDDVWRTLPATVVSNPRGTHFALTDENGKAFWDWAFYGGLARDAESVLASYGPDIVAEYLEVLKYKVGEVTLLARCQICDRIQMTRKGHDEGGKGAAAMVMADHGYTYPKSSHYRGGTLGERSGVCFGAKWQPYERDYRAIDAYIPEVKAAIAMTTMTLKQWQRAIRDPLARAPLRMGYGLVAKLRNIPWTHRHPDEIVVEPEDHDWPLFGKVIADEVQDRLDDLEFDLRMLVQRRERWRLVPTYGERMAPVAKTMAKSVD